MNTQILKIVDEIVRVSGQDAIILVHGDHGARSQGQLGGHARAEPGADGDVCGLSCPGGDRGDDLPRHVARQQLACRAVDGLWRDGPSPSATIGRSIPIPTEFTSSKRLM